MANLTMEKQLEIYTHEGTLALPQRLRTRIQMSALTSFECRETIDHFEVEVAVVPIVCCLDKRAYDTRSEYDNPMRSDFDGEMLVDADLPIVHHDDARIWWVKERHVLDETRWVKVEVCEPRDAVYCMVYENYEDDPCVHQEKLKLFLERNALGTPSSLHACDLGAQDDVSWIVDCDVKDAVWIFDNTADDVCMYVMPVGFCPVENDTTRDYEDGELEEFFAKRGMAYTQRHQMVRDLERYEMVAKNNAADGWLKLEELTRPLYDPKLREYYMWVRPTWYDDRNYPKFHSTHDLPGCFVDLTGKATPYYPGVVADVAQEMAVASKLVEEYKTKAEAEKMVHQAEINTLRAKADAARKAYYEEIQDFAKILLTAKVPVQAYDKDRKKVFERHPWTDPARPIERLQVTFERYQVVLMDLKEECMVSTCAYRPEYMASFAKVLKKFKTFVPLKVTRRTGVFQEL